MTASPTPFDAAQREIKSHTNQLIADKTLWQIVALFLLILLTAALAGVLHLATATKFVPYVVEVDKLGVPMVVSRAAINKTVDIRIMRTTLADFISQLRSVSSDPIVTRFNFFKAVSHLVDRDPASTKINEYFNKPSNYPKTRAKKETASVEILTIIPESKNSWQIDWRETIRNLTGEVVNTERWRAVVTVAIHPPTEKTSESDFRNNPFGIYIKDLDWNRVIDTDK